MRTVGSRRNTTWAKIRKTGIKLLSIHGYSGMNLRKLASDCDLQAGSLYNYFENKDELLATIIFEVMDDLQQSIIESQEGLQNPQDKLDKFTETMVFWHTTRKTEGVVVNAEFRRLTKKNYQKLLPMRKNFEAVLTNIIKDGIEQGEFNVSDIRLTSIMIINMLVGIAYWYKPNGRLKKEYLAKEYCEMARCMVGSTRQ